MSLPINQKIDRSGVWLQDATEASGFVWNNEFYYVYTDRDFANTTRQMKIIKWSDGSVVSTFGSGYGFQGVIVDSGTLWVYATTGNSSAHAIVGFKTTDLTTWTSLGTVYSLTSSYQVFNISVTKNGSNFIMTYEFLGPGYTGFACGFLTSSNGTSYSPTGTPLGLVSGVGQICSCPCLRYVGGTYYFWTTTPLSSPTRYHTWMAKSTNLSSWTWSRLTTLRPVLEFEDINTSDVDLTEFDGKVYGIYATGDQQTYQRLTYFTYDGTLAQYIQAYQQPN